MKLTETELNHIEQILDKHDIKFQEVYNELKDHLMSAVEDARTAGDTRDIAELLQHIIKTHFPGWWPFEEITKSFEKSYKRKIWRTFGVIIKSYMNVETSIVAIAMAASGLILRASKVQSMVLVGAIFLVSIIPLVYAIYFGRKIKAGKKRKSLVAGQLIGISYMLTGLINLVFSFGHGLDKRLEFLNPAHYQPVVLTTIFTVFLIYSMSSVKLVRREYQTTIL